MSDIPDVKHVESQDIDYVKEQLKIARAELNNLRQKIQNMTRGHHKDIEKIQNDLKNWHCVSCNKTKQLDENTKPTASSPEPSDLVLKPIGVIKTHFPNKKGTPRQPSIVSDTKGQIVLYSEMFTNAEHALEGLDGFSHMWIIFHFHKNPSCTKTKVAPPRLNGIRVGVFSSRSPHRPNPIGISLVRIDQINGAVIEFFGVDMVDGTPVLDIKPYIPCYDSPDVMGLPDGDFGFTDFSLPTRLLDGADNEYSSTKTDMTPTSPMISKTVREAPDGEEGINEASGFSTTQNMIDSDEPDFMTQSDINQVRVPDWINQKPTLAVTFTEKAIRQIDELNCDKFAKYVFVLSIWLICSFESSLTQEITNDYDYGEPDSHIGSENGSEEQIESNLKEPSPDLVVETIDTEKELTIDENILINKTDETDYDSEDNSTEETKVLIHEVTTISATIETETSTDEIEKSPEETETTTGKIETSNEEIETSPEETETTTGEIETSNEEIETSPEETETTTGEIETSNEEIETSPEETETTTGEIETSNEEIETSPEEIETSPEEIETSPEEIETSPEEIETSPEEIVTSLEETEAATDETESSFDYDTGDNITEETEITPEETETSTEEIENFPEGTETSTDEIETLLEETETTKPESSLDTDTTQNVSGTSHETTTTQPEPEVTTEDTSKTTEDYGIDVTESAPDNETTKNATDISQETTIQPEPEVTTDNNADIPNQTADYDDITTDLVTTASPTSRPSWPTRPTRPTRPTPPSWLTLPTRRRPTIQTTTQAAPGYIPGDPRPVFCEMYAMYRRCLVNGQYHYRIGVMGG